MDPIKTGSRKPRSLGPPSSGSKATSSSCRSTGGSLPDGGPVFRNATRPAGTDNRVTAAEVFLDAYVPPVSHKQLSGPIDVPRLHLQIGFTVQSDCASCRRQLPARRGSVHPTRTRTGTITTASAVATIDSGEALRHPAFGRKVEREVRRSHLVRPSPSANGRTVDLDATQYRDGTSTSETYGRLSDLSADEQEPAMTPARPFQVPRTT